MLRGGEEGMLQMIIGMQTWIARARDREEGQALVEYALILALIAVVSLVALEALGTGVSTQLQAIADAIAGA
jgi:pilus assembly protein Flp/PilA